MQVTTILALLACGACTSAKTFGPVVIVPGTGGSQLQATLNKPSVNHFYCSKTSDWYDLWLSVEQLLPPVINCWVDNIKLLYDSSSKTYTNNVGVTTRVVGWGSTDGFEYLDPSLKAGQSDYFATLVNKMVAAGGVRNISIRGSPYDFRHAPTSAYDGKYLDMMTDLVVDAYLTNDNQRVTILSHSMGCLYSLWFLNQMSPSWKQKYIARWVPTSGVFGGAGSGIKQLLSGSDEGIPGVSGMTVRAEQRSYESSMLLAPTPQVWGDFNLVRTPTHNYTASDYATLFPLSGDFSEGYERYVQVANLTANLVHPGVDVHHFYGTKVDTPTAFAYSSDSDFTKEPTSIMGDGDGTVPLRSLLSVQDRWITNPVFTFTGTAIPGQTHTGILKSDTYINSILGLLQGE